MGASVGSAIRTVEKEGARDWSHIALSYVVPVYFNQADTSTLSSLLEIYASYDDAVLDRVQFVIVDDGSPIPAALPRSIDLNALLLRITKDIPWNQSGARNLGVVYAFSDKILLTDVDLEIPADTLRRLICMRNRAEATLAAYRAGRGQLAVVLEARRAQLELAMQALMVEADTAKAQAQIVFYDQLEESR